MRNKYFEIILDGISKNQTVKKIHKRLYDETINKKVVSKSLLAQAIKLTNKTKKHVQKDFDIAIFIYQEGFDTSRKIINYEIVKKESEDKQEKLEDFYKEARKGKKIFFIASSHADSAKDHKDYQGKLYVDRYWWQTTGGNKQLEAFIKKNNIKTIQWVTGAPVYFVTRPHCRHYFKQITIDQALGGNYKIPHTKIGDRFYSTPAMATLEYYVERLKLLKKLYARRPSEKLHNLILKTEILVNKWKKAI